MVTTRRKDRTIIYTFVTDKGNKLFAQRVAFEDTDTQANIVEYFDNLLELEDESLCKKLKEDGFIRGYSPTCKLRPRARYYRQEIGRYSVVR